MLSLLKSIPIQSLLSEEMRNNAYKIIVSLIIFILLLPCNGISQFKTFGPLSPKRQQQILLARVFNLKQKNQILPAPIEKIRFCLFKKTVSCSSLL